MSDAGSVAVVVPAYNAAAWIRQALDSVFEQSYSISEIIVVDDGSTDRTPDIVRSYGSRINLIESEHRGVPQRNRGIAESQSQFVAFLDADDFWDRSKIETQMKRRVEVSCEWVICNALRLDEPTGSLELPTAGSLPEGDILEALILGNFIVASTPIVSRKALDEVGGFEEGREFMPGEDWDMWLRLAARYPVASVCEALATLRLHKRSFMNQIRTEQGIRGQERVVHRAVLRAPARLRRLERRAYSNIYYAAGVRHFRMQQVAEARRHFVNSWMREPFRLEAIAYIAATTLGPRAAAKIVDFRRRRIANSRK